jgi:hypothetical protein
MNQDYEFEWTILKGSLELDKLDEPGYKRIYDMLVDSDGEDLDRLLIINNELIKAFRDYRLLKVSNRLVKGAELIEVTTDPKERARLMVHYNNLLKELTA